jgi:hypothetical protein
VTHRLNPRSVAHATNLAHAAIGSVCTPGLCAHYAAGFYGWGHSGGDAHELHAAAQAAGVVFHSYRVGDYVPPGALVLYLGPGHGHTAISAGAAMIVSTDLPTSGRFGLVSILAPCHSWGEPTPVWAEPVFQLASAPVGPLTFPTTLAALPATPPPVALPVVHMSNLRAGLRNIDVLRFQRALRAQLTRVGVNVARLNPSGATGLYGPQTVALCAAWQHHLGFTGAAANGAAGVTSTTKLGHLAGFSVHL